MTSEAELMRAVQVRISQLGARCFRNNLGSLKDATGRWVRFGVANPGGSDLLGWKSVRVTQSMVGKTVAIFLAVEVKRPGGKRSPEQEAFIAVGKLHGGLAGFAESVTQAQEIVNDSH